MNNWQIILAIIIVGLSIIMPIYYSQKRKKENQSKEEAIERMQIREYGRKINDETRANQKKNKYRTHDV
jgi:uncharacterized protein YpmB